MHQQPGDRSCANEAIGGAHYGPINVRLLLVCTFLDAGDRVCGRVQIYMAKVEDATTAVGSSAAWFKVSEIGLPSSNPDYWGTGAFTIVDVL